MKLWLPWLLLAILAAYILISKALEPDVPRETNHQRAIDSLSLYNSRLEEALEITRDSLDAAFLHWENAKKDVEIANKRTKQTRMIYEGIIFRHFDSDSVRLRELARHFPSVLNR